MAKENKKDKSSLFIIISSVAFLILLTIGMFIFSKDTSLAFLNDGYIITATSDKIYFTKGTTYKENLLQKYVFKNDQKEEVSIELDSFVHYDDNSVAFLKNGALMDLNQINNSIVPYYNITNQSLISYENNTYKINSAQETYTLENWIGRINENKYIVVGSNLTLKLPGIDQTTNAQYFELTFLEEGIVKIENQEVSYQTATEGTYIYVNDDITLNLGTKQINYQNDKSISLSQITIDGNENIDIIPSDENKVNVDDNNNSENNSNGDNTTNNGNNDNNNNNDNDNQSGEENGTTSGTTDGNNNDNQNNDNSTGSDNTSGGNGTQAPTTTVETDNIIQLIDASVTANSIKALFAINNKEAIEGNLLLNIINTQTGAKAYARILDENQSTTEIEVLTLTPNTNYLLTIEDTKNGISRGLYQKSFRTEEIGLSLEKVYTTSSSLTYKINFDENSNVKSATISLYNENMDKLSTQTITKGEIEELTFNNLSSNTTYTTAVDSIVMEGLELVNIYTISKTDITLKEAPIIKEANLTIDYNEIKSNYNLLIKGIEDKDSSIISYTYNIYEIPITTDETSTTENKLVKSITQKNLDTPVKLTTNEEISADSNYRYNVTIEYDDNEKTRKIDIPIYSNPFIIKEDEPIVEFIETSSTFNTLKGTLTIRDTNCYLPIAEHPTCPNRQEANNFEIIYYTGNSSTTQKTSLAITKDNVMEDGRIVIDVELTNLSANSGYIMQLIGNRYLNDELQNSVLIGNSFTGTTKNIDETTSLTFSAESNVSTDENPININTTIKATNISDSSLVNALNKITIKLYKGNEANQDQQIGKEVVLEGTELKNSFFNAENGNIFNITNQLFEILNVNDLIEVSGGNLLQSYTIEVSNAQDAYGTAINILENTYVFNISLGYILERELSIPSIVVEPITNGELIEEEQNTELEQSTIVGYEIASVFDTTKLKSILAERVEIIDSINYYICDSKEENCLTITSQDQYTKELYFEDIDGFNRGGSYIFKFDIKIKNSNDGTIYTYPQIPVKNEELFQPPRQAPIYSFFILNSTADSITYRYYMKDVDNAIKFEDDNKQYFYLDGITASEEEETNSDEIVPEDSSNITTKIPLITNQYTDITLNNLSNQQAYRIMFNQELIDGQTNTYEVINTNFEGYYELTDEVSYELIYSNNDNRLGIKINAGDFIDRILQYHLTITDTSQNLSDFSKIYTAKDITLCPGTTEESCLILDYAEISKYKSKELKVSLEAYYDNGLIGLKQTSEVGFVFQNRVNEYLTWTEDGFITQDYVQEIYNFTYDETTNQVTITKEDANRFLDLAYLNLGVLYMYEEESKESTEIGIFDPKAISTGFIDTTSDSFRFDSIIPKISPKVGRTINSLQIFGTITGLVTEDLAKEYQKEADGKYYLYAELYELETTEDGITQIIEPSIQTIKIPITIKETTITMGNGTFTNLKVETTYQYKIFAYMLKSDGTTSTYEKVQLYDGSSTCLECATDYFRNSYEATTLLANEIFKNVTLSYNSATTSSKYAYRQLSMKLDFYNNKNYSIAYELSHDDEIILTNRDNPPKATETPALYPELPEDFLFGSNYYTLTLYAIADNSTDENPNIVTLYNEIINLKELSRPTITITPQAEVSENNGEKSYDISVTLSVNDQDKTIVDGNYNVYITTVGENSEIVATYPTTLNATKGTTTITFKGSDYGFTQNTTYFVMAEADVYTNNLSMTDEEKVAPYTVRGAVTTSGDYGVKIGGQTVSITSASSFELKLSNSSNLDKITKITFTINLLGGNFVQSKTVTKTNDSIFKTSDYVYYTLDVTNLSFTKDSTYEFIIGYYVLVDGQEELINGETYATTIQY